MSFRGLVIVATLCLGLLAPTLAHDSLQVSSEHGAVKDTIQHDQQTLPFIEAALVTLRRLIAENEAAFGGSSPEVGILLLDIGEAAIKRGLLLEGEEQADGLRRGMTAIDAGDPLVTAIEGQYLQATVARARGQFMKGRALLALGRYEEAEDILRRSLAIHWNRFDDHAWQLQVFPFLFDAVRTPEKKLAVAQGELKIATVVYGNNIRVDEARKRVQQATTFGDPGLAGYDAARAEAIRLAKVGDSEGAYAVLSTALPMSAEARRIFIARIKPSPFFIYADPDAPDSGSWDELQDDLRLDAYDKVATRFMIDNDLQPFIEEGRNNLSSQLMVMLSHYDRGDKDGARDFCRLIPDSYLGYSEPTLSDYCDTLSWVAWNLSMGGVGPSTRLLEASLDLLPPLESATDAENAYRWEALGALLEVEAYYGSADTFLAAYERVERSPVLPSDDMSFYAAIISDDADGVMSNLDSALAAAAYEGDGGVISARGIGEKLSLVGGETARSICTSADIAIAPILRGIMCVTGQRPDLVPYNEIEQDIRDGEIHRTTPGVTDWPFLEIARNPAIQEAINDNVGAFVSGIFRTFTARALTPRELAFLANPVSHDDFAETAGHGIVAVMDEDFDPAYLAQALWEAGELEMARSWASWGTELYESTEGPQTIFTAYLAEEHAEHTYRDGWAWMLAGRPVLAERSFSTAIPEDLSYERASVNYEASASLDWERVIGAYQGRMQARLQLGDKVGAALDAQGLVDYVSFVLNLQSFTRHETREIVARVARPSLRVALRVLAGVPKDQTAVSYAFRAVQLLNQTGTAKTVSRLGARLAAVAPELGALARERESLRARWAATGEGEDALKIDLASAIDALDQRLGTEFPEYVELAGTIDVPVADLKAQLAKGEALVSFTVGEDSTIALVVTDEESHLVSIDIGKQYLSYLVEDLRRSLDIRGGRLPSFRADVAFELYNVLLAPIEHALNSKPEHLILSLSGVLESVPFSVLVAENPDNQRLDDLVFVADYYSVSRIPSVSSLLMMRQVVAGGVAGSPFIGIGDPLLEGDPADFRGLAVNAAFTTRGAIDSAALKALPRLAETADELRHLLHILGGSEAALLLGQAANERQVKAMSLADYRVVAFATHGLVAGEVGGFREPGLVLTPPETPDGEDDGYLSASEIAELDLNAEIVLLSACNTAAPGEVGAEGLSGLAKAFFFAGAKALLVSHWSVESTSATELTTRLMEQRLADPELSYAAALRKAMISLRDDKNSDYAHPALWGSFEVVGG